MPFALIFIGLLFTIAGVRNTQSDFEGNPGLYTLLREDFGGKDSFAFWVVAVVAVGSIGYVTRLKSFSNWLLALIFIAMLLAEENKNGSGGFFAKFTSALNMGVENQPQEDYDNYGNEKKSSSSLPFNLPDLGISELLKEPGGADYLKALQAAALVL